MLTLTRLPTSSALPTLPWEVVFTRPTMTTSSRKYDFYDIQQELINILPVDLTSLLLVVICVSGYVAYLVLKRCRSRLKNKTLLYLHVCDNEDAVSWLLTSLPYLPIYYKVEASKSIFLTLTQTYFSATMSFSEALKVICKPLGSEVIISREIVIYAWKLVKARKILAKKHYIALLVYDEKMLIDVAILRGWGEMRSPHLSVDAPQDTSE